MENNGKLKKHCADEMTPMERKKAIDEGKDYICNGYRKHLY